MVHHISHSSSSVSTVSNSHETVKSGHLHHRGYHPSSSDVDEEDQLFFVTSYSNFDKLAHGPRGTQAQHSLYIYRFDPTDGSLVLLNVQGDAVLNPAFTRYHPKHNVVYTCTEDIEEEGLIYAYQIQSDGQLQQLGDPIGAGGTSTCYLTIDKDQQHLLVVNYWDSTLSVIRINEATGALEGPIKSMYDPKHGKKMVASAKKDGGANHSCNDASTIQQRQADPHSHALVLDPFVGTVAYVPDLGKDVIREFLYDRTEGQIVHESNMLPSGLCTGHPDGPRYLEFHPQYNVAYVVNELSSTVAVFEVDRDLLQEMDAAARNREDMTRFKGRSTLRLIQSISTLPPAFPKTMNTCGRICVHQSGHFVVVSNRGHQSICVYKVKRRKQGRLDLVGHFHTRGDTPRHFQFDHSGQYLLVANQDTDSVAVFSFNLSTGRIQYTGNEYSVPSPNFVCCCPVYPLMDVDEESVNEGVPAVASVDTAEEELAATSLRHSRHPSLVMRHKASDDGGETSDSDDSTFRAHRRPKPKARTAPASVPGPPSASPSSLEVELEQARREIEQLRRLLETRK